MDLRLVVFLVVTAGLLGLFYLALHLLQRDRAKVRQRMAAEFGKGPAAPTPNPLFKDMDSMSLTPVGSEPGRGEWPPPGPARRSPREWLADLLLQADVPVQSGPFLALALGMGLSLGAAAALLAGWGGGAAAGLVGGSVPFVFLLARRDHRRKKFLQQLPGAFDLMARVIRAGQSVPQSLQAVAEAFEEPLAGEFASCQHHQNLGLRPEVAFREMAARSGIPELRIFVTAMMIQRQTGGNLSEMLERLASLVRARLRLRQQIRTLTAEGRLQGLTLVVLPFLMFGVMYFVNRQYAQVLLEHVPLLLATAGCMAVGVLWIRKIVNMEV